MLPSRICQLFFLPAVLLMVLGLLVPQPAFAIQTHGGIEGVVAHEVGHFLFFSGILFILVQGGSDRWSTPGWPFFRRFLYLVLLWNVLTFIEHIMDLGPLADNVVRLNGVATGYTLDSAAGVFYYLTRLDHLILVPALYFFMRALQVWTAKSGDKP